jgi:septum site-determining protein MinC
MFRPRSYMAFATTPQPPIVDWLSELDASFGALRGLFCRSARGARSICINLSSSAIGQLVANLEGRSICILGIEGGDPAK